MLKSVYLDYAATTPVDPLVVEKMLLYLSVNGVFGNPASSHGYGSRAKEAIDIARSQVADLIQAEPSEIIWTSGATEANNLALKGAATLYKNKGKHIVTLKTEHASVLECCQQLEKQGFLITYLNPEPSGLLHPEALESALRPDTILVSIMHINNETGLIQDIQTLSEITASRNILFHTDAAQSAGKIPVNVKKMPVDLISLSAHKIYGPKGVGALFVRRKPRVRVAPQIHGGSQEQGMRSGTLPTHQIIGMGEALRLAKIGMDYDFKKIKHLRERFCEGMNSKHIIMNSDAAHSYPGILNLRFDHKNVEHLIQAIPEVAFSTGSACLSKESTPSHVLRSMGLTRDQVQSSARFSFGRFTTEDEIDFAVKHLCAILSYSE